MAQWLNRLFPDPSVKKQQTYLKRVADINALEPSVTTLSADELKEQTEKFRARLATGETLDALLPLAFAVVREAARRTLGQRHYDVQMAGGMALHDGNIAEMRTGEGKTLTATAPLYVNALAKKGAHLVTVNDYLAKRDAVWMGQVFYALGMSVGCIQHDASFVYDPAYRHVENEEASDAKRDATGSFRVDMDYLRPVSRKEAYAADVTYGTNNEFGFDYLRDNMVIRTEQLVQRPLFYSIVDEVDSILIDEARTPLIISAPSETPSSLYMTCAHIAAELTVGTHYNVDEKLRAATLTDEGISRVEQALGVENLYTAQGAEMVHHMEEALRAHALYRRDKDYVVREGEIIIVDEFTGRLMEGRRYSEGLHQAIEAKEGVTIKQESQTLATITFQNYFRLYEKLAGMTGTGATDAEEFHKTYGMDVIIIPPNRPSSRTDLPDRVYKSELGKFRAVIAEIKRLHEQGQPVLVGTASIEKNELFGQMMTAEGLPFEILNAKNHEREGAIIAQAGRRGAVTVATNMAGRGVDIVLGGNPSDPEEARAVRELGGLAVIGTERHEARRIDNQLRGRSGRQGDPGATQFYVSMEDDLMRIFGSDRMKRLMDRMGIPDDMPIENKMVSRSLEKAQERVEGNNYDARKHLLSYDDVLNRHREVVYKNRRAVLEAYDGGEPQALRELILGHFDEALEEVVMFHTGEEVHVPAQFQEALPAKGDTNRKEILETLSAMLPLSVAEQEEISPLLKETSVSKAGTAKARTEISEKLMAVVRRAYDELEGRFADRKDLRDLERAVILRSIDRLWIDHLDVMTALRQSVNLRGYGQRDPLIEYRREAFGLFNRLLLAVSMEVANNFFKFAQHVAATREAEELAKSVFERRGIHLSAPAKTSDVISSAQPAVSVAKVGRNDPCPCGSGKKYKKCHGA
ncbi:preprotein translocase subunit SecA [Candidatus Uhrbacteria bacterium]|nr:preprotein translocase subunit SecA [Candidatus Uhrbacteria bacterium]